MEYSSHKVYVLCLLVYRLHVHSLAAGDRDRLPGERTGSLGSVSYVRGKALFSVCLRRYVLPPRSTRCGRQSVVVTEFDSETRATHTHTHKHI